MTYLSPDAAVDRCESDEQYLDIIHHHPEVFAALYFDYEIKPYQAEMMHFARENLRSLIRVPAQHGKSTLMSKVFPVWEIVCNPNIRIILVMKTEKDSFDYSDQIRNKMTDPNERLVVDFGPFFTGKETWTNAAFNVAQRQVKDTHQTMEFYGAGGAVLGHRCDLTIMDDVVTDKTAGTINQRDNQRQWFRESVQTGPRYMWPAEAFDPQEIRERVIGGDEDMIRWAQHRINVTREGKVRLLKVPAGIYWPTDITYQRIVVCGTTFHPKDLYFDLLNDETYASLYFDCYVRDPETGALEALWPEQMPLEALEAEKKSSGILSFNKRFRNIALDEGELVFKEPFVRGGEFDGVEFDGVLDRDRSWGDFDESWFRTFGLDPASGSTSRFSTWPSAVTLGVDEEDPQRKMYFIDIFRQQMGIEDIISLALNGRLGGGIPGFYKQYRYQRGFIEANACQKWLLQHHRVTEAMEQGPLLEDGVTRLPAVNLEPHYTGNNKWDEVMGMSSIVRYFQNSTYSIPYSTPADQIKTEELLEQFLQFPKGIFDWVMATWFATLAAESMVQQFESFYLPGHSGRMITNPIYLTDEDNPKEAVEEVYISDRRKRLMGLL